jgi:hypothetical protein
MTYKFKLSRRLAMSHRLGYAACLLTAACAAGEPIDYLDADAPAASSREFALTPHGLVLETNQKFRFAAFSRSSFGDSMQLGDVVWSASGGSISSDGTFSATAPGSYKVAGRGRNRNRSDSTVVVVLPPQPTLSELSIDPDGAEVAAGTARAFSASGRLSDGTAVAIAVTWAATGGAIDAAGVYRAGNVPGTYEVVARNSTGTVADTAVIVIPASATPSIVGLTIAPGALTLAAGASNSYTAQGWVAGSNTPVPATVTWSATGGSISPSGVYTAGNLPGTYRIAARSTSTDLADTVLVTVGSPTIAPEAPRAGSNEPIGYTRLTEHLWNTAEQDGWYHDGDRTRFRLLDEAGAPLTGRFIRAPFLAGETGGPVNATPFRIQKNIQAAQAGKLYWSYWLRVSPNFQGHPTATNKVNFAWMRGSNILFLSLEGVDGGPLNLMPRLQTYSTSDPREYFQPNQGASANFSRGAWHHVEMVLEANTASDRNGRIAVWLDGVKTHDYRDLRFVVSGEGHTWDYVDATPLWGGGGGVIREAMNMDYGPMYLSIAR